MDWSAEDLNGWMDFSDISSIMGQAVAELYDLRLSRQ
jgi:hypothetical protein